MAAPHFLTNLHTSQLLLQQCYIKNHPSREHLFPYLCIFMLTTVGLIQDEFSCGGFILGCSLTEPGPMWHQISRKCSPGRGWGWETMLHASLMCLRILQAKALTAFVVDYFFQRCMVNRLRR